METMDLTFYQVSPQLTLPQVFICIIETQLLDCIVSIFHNVLTHFLA